MNIVPSLLHSEFGASTSMPSLTDSGTDGGSSSSQHYSHAKSGTPLIQTSNQEVGSVVLLKNSQVPRNEWPLGLVTQTFLSKDGKVRQVEVKIIKLGETTLFLSSVTEIMLLLPTDA